MESIVEEFTRGSDDYWAGKIARGWENKKLRMTSPYIMGWYLESQADNGLDLDLRG